MDVLKKVIILAIALVLAYYTAEVGGELHRRLFGPSGTFVDLRSLSGLPLTYAFFLSLLFTAVGGDKKYWWMGALLIPAAAFELYFDLAHLYFPILLGFAGWLLGLLVLKFSTRSRAGFTRPR